jgi:hypothetical protein
VGGTAHKICFTVRKTPSMQIAMQKPLLKIVVNNLTPEQKRAEQLANMLMEKRFVVYKLPTKKVKKCSTK